MDVIHATQEMTMKKKLLMIVTSNDAMGSTGRKTGVWAEEIAVPYYSFADAGFAIDMASPKGGQAPLDPGSLKEAGQNSPEVDRMLADKGLMKALSATHKTADVGITAYDAVFFPGGHGTMWDFADDQSIKAIVEHADRNGLTIGAVCHGVSALVSAKRLDGKPLVAGRRVNSFTDAEEEAAGLTKAMPFLLETRLREQGAKFESGANWQAFSVQDGLLFTGQNPQSSERVANAMLSSLNVKPGKAA
jgi:putative intracellular protease/amidase